jgi:hypothetical protein
MKINTIAGIYAGDKVTKTKKGEYAIQAEHDPTPYLNQVFDTADFNKDGDITSDGISRLEKAVLEAYAD